VVLRRTPVLIAAAFFVLAVARRCFFIVLVVARHCLRLVLSNNKLQVNVLGFTPSRHRSTCSCVSCLNENRTFPPTTPVNTCMFLSVAECPAISTTAAEKLRADRGIAGNAADQGGEGCDRECLGGIFSRNPAVSFTSLSRLVAGLFSNSCRVISKFCKVHLSIHSNPCKSCRVRPFDWSRESCKSGAGK